MMFSKEELIKVTNAQVLKDSITELKSFDISTDTRTITENDIYLPLKGETFDGERFIEAALQSGAKAYITTKEYVLDDADLVLKVDDTKIAYLKLASYHRHKINPITVAITGSSGKTTTKELVYSVLKQKFNTKKTYSNHNNEIGFCQTVMSIDNDTQALIVEIGMRGLGEIELVSNYLNPNYAIITNSGTAHVGRLGSLENIAKAKCEVVCGMENSGVLISKNQEIIKNNLNFSGETVFYSLSDAKILEISQSYSKFEYKDKIYELNVDGEYNIENALSAIELGYKLGLTYEQIKQGLAEYKPIEKRWETITVNDLNFINDSYNANPDSMKASVKAFIELYRNPVVVLGDMGELGTNELFYHGEVGQYLAQFNCDVTYLTVGNLARAIAIELEAKGFKCKSFDNVEDVARYIVANFDESYTIFLKASRSMKFENIIESIKRGI